VTGIQNESKSISPLHQPKLLLPRGGKDRRETPRHPGGVEDVAVHAHHREDPTLMWALPDAASHKARVKTTRRAEIALVAFGIALPFLPPSCWGVLEERLLFRSSVTLGHSGIGRIFFLAS
jgi:hypothetical protein